MNRCYQCGGKFGLVRHHYLRHPFCSRRCVERFKGPVIEEIARCKKAMVDQSSNIETASGSSSELKAKQARNDILWWP
jgi:hypothetical protein